MQEIIGGEFEISNLIYTEDNNTQEELQYFSSGRGALFAILKHLIQTKKTRRILLPDYLCRSIVTTVISSGLEYAFYSIGENLKPDERELDEMINEEDTILVINYFGLLSLESVYRNIRKKHERIFIIEDDVQALQSFLNPIPENVDFTFTSLRKWLPVPDGGLAQSADKTTLSIPTQDNTFAQYKISGMFLKGNRNIGIKDDRIYLNLLEQGEVLIDENLDSEVSDFTRAYFDNKYPNFSFSLRRRNTHYLLEGLNKIGIRPLVEVPDNTTPLFVPIWLENRDKVRKMMFKENIFCPVHWPLEGLKLKKGAEMAAHELSLIIDQRYTFSDLDRILNILAR